MANLPMTYDMSKKLTKNAFTVSGYTFTGWNSQKDGSGTAYIDEQLVSNLSSQAGGHVDLYAQWRANAQEIRYHANADDVDGETESTSGVTDGTVSVEENGFTKTGYTFVNWNTKPTGDGTDYDAGDSVKLPAGGIDLYAKWSPNSYTISFVANHKSSNGSMSDMPMTYDVAKNLTRNAFTVPGYTFTGWNSKQDGSGTMYADAAEVKNLTATAGGNVKLYAQWKADSQSITYDKNADKATGETKSTTGATDDTVEISGNGFTRTGYTFTGWNKSADGSGTAYNPSDDVVLPAGGITLYAQWKANTYKIRFDENHEGATGKMGDLPMTYDVSKKLTKNAFSASGYTFTGWNTKANGSGTAYADAADAVNLSATQDAVVTLYAQWRADPQEIRYHANIEGATGETDATAGVTDGTVEVSENGYEKVGYTFVGWNSDSDGDGSEYKVGSDVKLPAGGIDAYAQWAPNRYIIRFNGNHDGVTGEMPDQQMTYDVEASLDMNAYVLHGYTFAGWSTKADGSGTDYTDGKKVLNLASDNGAVIELYAQWTNDPQSIRYEINSDDGSGTTHETVGTTDGSVTVSDSDFDRPGYGFDGWNTQPDGSGDMYQPGDEAILPPGGLNFYAQWSPNTYTIRFDANHEGASGNMDDMMITYDVAAKLTKNGYAVDGYTFVGWKLAEQVDDANDEANARNDDAVENSDSDSDADVDADANCEGSADGTDVDGNETDGTSSDDAENATDDTANVDNANTDNAADDGADASDDIIDFSDEEEVINLTTVDGGVVELDAVWSSSESRIVYDANLGGIVDDETGELVADAEHVDVADDTDGIGETPDTVGRTDEIVSVAENGFVNDGYHFVSWNTKADGTGDTFIPGDEFKLTAGATTLYAMWANDPASITYDKNAPLATGTMEQTYGLIGQDVRVAENGFENLGFDFVEWNTEADGSGTAYAPGNEMTLVEHDVTLYAQWEASPVIVQTGAATGVGIAIAGIGGAVAYAVTNRKKKQRQ